MLRKALSAAAVAATALTATAALAAEDIKSLNFGIISTETAQNLKSQWEPFLADMGKALRMEVKAFFASDYAGVIEGMRFKKVDVAWYGNKSGMEAVDRAGAEIFAQQVDLYGRPGYWSLLIVHKDSPIKTIDDVIKNPGKWTFGNGDPNSTSGFLVPSVFFFQKYGIDAKTHFKRVVNASHEVNALAVANKQVDIATNNTENLYDPDNPSQKVGRLFKSNPEKAEQIRVIWKSPLIPSDPIAYRKDLPAELKYAIQGFFLSYGRLGPDAERERKVLAGVSAGLAPYRPSSNDQLIPVREMELSKAREKLSSDASLAPAEKAAKTAAIDKALEALRQRAAILAN